MTDGPQAPAKKPPISTVSRSEWRWATGWAVVIMLATVAPYLLAWAFTPDDLVFTGAMYNADDHWVYFAWMRQGRDGDFFFRNLFTNEAQTGQFVHLYFWGLGLLSRITTLSIPAVYHVGRVAAGIGLLVLVYRWSAFFTPDVFARRWVFWVTAVSSGLGWLAWNGTVDPQASVDTWQAEALTFTSLYVNGLFTVSLLLMLGIVVLLLLAEECQCWGRAVAAGVLGFLLANIHSYDVISLAAVWAVYLVVRTAVSAKTARLPWLYALIAAAVTAPAVAYQAWYYLNDPAFHARVGVPTRTTSLGMLLMGYGLLLPLALAGLPQLFRRELKHPRIVLPVVWALVGLLVAYAPVPYQRKLLMGVHLPIALLAGLGLAGLAAKVTQGRHALLRVALAGTVVALTAISSALFVARDLQLATEKNITSTGRHPVWWPESDVAAARWIGEHTPRESVVLTHPITGAMVPATSGRTVYAGHFGETPDYGAKWDREILPFLLGRQPEEQAEDWLAEKGITHVLAGTMENAVAGVAKESGGRDFRAMPMLRAVHRIGDITVYAVEPALRRRPQVARVKVEPAR